MMVQVVMGGAVPNFPRMMLISKKISLKGAFRFTTEFNTAVSWLARRVIDPLPLLSAEYPFAQIMEEINYIPNRAPAMLLNAQSYSLGVLIPFFQNQLFADILAGIESVTSGHNYQTLMANYNYDRDSEEESVINLLSYNIDGIILSEKYHTLRTVKFLRSTPLPIVELMDIQGDRLDMEVGFDNRQAAFDMVSTLLDKRRRRKILYLGSKDDIRDEQRYHGYCDAMTRRGLAPLRINPRAISSIHLGIQLMRDALTHTRT
ncbi:TPA: positive regulator of L-idonate catabolism [Salmonella enterica subsp. houtenae]|nr:positive regulator of L-idonate catabolism [Salmonella enterica subsp. houtenae]HAU2711305.1 positive regulator of L-idonate catabolism [Salmonella enterica subsp. houtenae]